MTRLVLWDIDHTLIDTRGVGRQLSAAAFEQATGVPLREQATIDGITEQVIFRETARLHGITTGRADFERFASALAEQHVKQAAELGGRGHALEGAAAVLHALVEVPGVRQTVVTGNVKAVARTKLAVFGLDGPIDWAIGAYGEDGEARADLVRLALSRASADPSEAVLIGDTPADVEGALSADVKVIAVATGRSTATDLHAAGADHVLPDLSATESLVSLITG
ncbi:HAD family hydrolase [Streptomyces aureoverticillatus]|uniref:HAD family hydrolase n=1 Tax=Streptomyces aureoverticillatus TaxID=66871 RepID=UPI0013DA19C5|nr:HAD hydrolase-like protein [Streptomyces aureoverticillatus]QIB44622.1 HAD family hydrolase [Streptomyces aureoverticillatus]